MEGFVGIAAGVLLVMFAYGQRIVSNRHQRRLTRSTNADLLKYWERRVWCDGCQMKHVGESH